MLIYDALWDGVSVVLYGIAVALGRFGALGMNATLY